MCGHPHRRKENSSKIVGARSWVLTCVRPLMQLFTCRGPVWEFADRVQFRATCLMHAVQSGFPDPVSPTVAPYFPFDLPTPTTPRDRDRASPRSEPGKFLLLAIRAQMTRAILLAKATLTSIGGLRSSMPASHDPRGPFLVAQRTAALAPMMSSRRNVRSPIFEVAPSFCFPPVECCSGVSPSQAAKSRPRLGCFSLRRERDDGRRDHRPYPGDAHQPTRQIVFFGAPRDLDVQKLSFRPANPAYRQDGEDRARRPGNGCWDPAPP